MNDFCILGDFFFIARPLRHPMTIWHHSCRAKYGEKSSYLVKNSCYIGIFQKSHFQKCIHISKMNNFGPRSVYNFRKWIIFTLMEAHFDYAGGCRPRTPARKNWIICVFLFLISFSVSKTLLFGRNQALKPCSIDGAWKIMQNALVKVSNGLQEAELWPILVWSFERWRIILGVRISNSRSAG